MKVETRPASGEDIDWLADLFIRSMRESIATARGSWDASREETQFRRQLRLSDTRVIRAESSDIGFLTVRTLDDGSVEVHTLCLEPDWQCAGIGTHVMKDIMQGDGSSVKLSVLKANTRAQRFYERLGFVEIGTSAHHVRMNWLSQRNSN